MKTKASNRWSKSSIYFFINGSILKPWALSIPLIFPRAVRFRRKMEVNLPRGMSNNHLIKIPACSPLKWQQSFTCLLKISEVTFFRQWTYPNINHRIEIDDFLHFFTRPIMTILFDFQVPDRNFHNLPSGHRRELID